jgi:pimeloyl-ACP methyl ester carboxylesterase
MFKTPSGVMNSWRHRHCDVERSSPVKWSRLVGICGSLWAFAGAAFIAPAAAQGLVFPAGFRVHNVSTNGTTIHVRVGGKGSPVVLLHGYAETGDMWAPLAANLARERTVIVPDLRGMGLSARAEKGFEKKNQADDIAGVMDALNVASADVVAHDIGNMVAFALAAKHPARVSRLVLMDAPIPGVGPWDEILKSPLLWHFRFGGPDMERLVAGRERIYLDRFWNEFAADPKRFGRPRAGTMRGFTHARARCAQASYNSRRSTRTPSITAPFSPPAVLTCRCLRSVAHGRSARPWRRSCARRRATWARL